MKFSVKLSNSNTLQSEEYPNFYKYISETLIKVLVSKIFHINKDFKLFNQKKMRFSDIPNKGCLINRVTNFI